MRTRSPSPLTFSNVVSVIALFVALGGTTYAAVKLKPDSVGSRHVRDDSLSGRDVREGDLGQVPSAARADSAAFAEGAASAGNAGLIDGVDSEQLARRGLLLTDVRGAHQSGNPPGRFTCLHSDGVSCDAYWANRDATGGFADAAFGRDDFGIVHLQGSIAYTDMATEPVAPGPVLTLPDGLRPSDDRVFTVLRNGTDPVRLDIGDDGKVSVGGPPPGDGDWYSLDGIDFAAP
jgi:hypothetical protein